MAEKGRVDRVYEQDYRKLSFSGDSLLIRHPQGKTLRPELQQGCEIALLLCGLREGQLQIVCELEIVIEI